MNLKNFEEIDGEIKYNKWIEWNHFGIPNNLGIQRELIRLVLLIFGHCLVCTKLDGDYFVESNMPQMPFHDNCDCTKITKSKPIVLNRINAVCDLRKLTEYIFTKNNSKKRLFESWGYTIKDSQFLKKIFEDQATVQYKKGCYKLKDVDLYGQRIAIEINLNGNIFYSGWMVYPEGLIKNTTPFGGWKNETV